MDIVNVGQVVRVDRFRGGRIGTGKVALTTRGFSAGRAEERVVVKFRDGEYELIRVQGEWSLWKDGRCQHARVEVEAE